MAKGVKCAFLPRQIGGMNVTASNLEERLNCKVLWGFGSTGALPKTHTKRIGETYLAFFYAYDVLAERKQLTKPSEIPDLVVFDDTVDHIMFALAFKDECYAQFTYDAKLGERLYKLNKECLLVRNFYTSIEKCADSFNAYETAGHKGNNLVPNRISWFTSMSAATDTSYQYLGRQIDSIIQMIDTGW